MAAEETNFVPDNQANYLEQLRQAAYSKEPILPNPKPVNIGINESIRGDFSTGPNPGFKNPNERMGSQILDYMSQADAWAYDKNRFAKTYDFGSDWKHTNFERYYSSRAYKKLGFSPYRDNDLHYNNNTSAYDDFLRATTGNLRLFGHGFISMEEGSDSAGEAMERVNATYGSTRGGLGGFTSNLYLSAGYTQGLVSRVILEELALAYATGQSGFSAAPVTIPAMGARLVKFGKDLYSVGKNLGKTLKAFRQLDNIDVARKIFNGAKAAPGAAASFVAPRTAEFIGNLRKGAEAGQEFTELNSYAKAFKGFGSMYMDYREMRLAMGEGGMEGKMLQTKMNEDLINDYYNKNGFMPEGKDAEDIYNKSVTAGKMNSLYNSLLIYGSNKIVFGRLFKGVPSFNAAARKVIESPIGELKRMPLKIGQNFFELAKGGFKSSISKALFSSSFSPLSRKYLLENITEGLQEASQDALASGFEEYYKNTSTNPVHTNYAEMLDSLGRGFGKQFSKEGFETFASGYLMSTMVQPAISLVSDVAPMQGRRLVPQSLRDRWGIQSYEEVVKERENRKNAILESMNQVVKDPYKMNTSGIDYMAEVVEHQKKIAEAERTGDKVAIEDARKEMYFDHLYRTIVTGHTDQLKEYFKAADKLTDEEFAEAYNVELSKVGNSRAELKKAEKNLDTFEKIYNKQNERFPDYFDEKRFKKDSIEYKAALRGRRAMMEAKKYAMFANFSFLDASERMKDTIDDFSNNLPLSKANPNDLTMLFDTGSIKNKITALDNEIRILKGDPKSKTQLAETQRLRDTLSRYTKTLDFVMNIQAAVKEEKKTPGVIRKMADTSKMTKGSTVVNKEGKEFIVTDIIGDEVKLKDKAGKKYTRKNREGLELVTPGEEESVLFNVDDPLQYAYSTLYKEFKSYLQAVADVNNEQLFDENVDNAFMKIKDFYRLDNDARAMGAVANVLHNPDAMFNLAVRLEKSIAAIDEKKSEFNKEAYKKNEKAKDYNTLFNVLYDAGFQLTPEGIDQVVEGIMPKEFYDEPEQKVFDETTDKAKYEKAKGIVQWYFDLDKAEKEAEAKRRQAEEEEAARKAAEEEAKKKAGQQPPPPPPAPPAPTVVKAVEYDTAFDEMPEDLQAELLRGARVANATKNNMFFDENASNDELQASDWFTNDYLKNYKHAKTIIDKFNAKMGFKQKPTSQPGQTPDEVVARLDLVSIYGMDQDVVDKMTTDQVLEEYARRKSQPPVSDLQKSRQEKYNAQYNALVSGQVLDNDGNPVYEEDKGIGANGLSTLTDKKYGHGHVRTSGLNSLEVLEKLLDGSDFSGMFGKIGSGAYSTWESGKFIIVSDNIDPTTNNKLNLNEIEIILNAGLSPFAQELANKYPNVIFKDFNGKTYKTELTTKIEGQVGTSNYSVDKGLIFYNNPDGTVTPVANPEGKPVMEVITDDIERRRQEEFDRKSSGNSVIAADYLFTGGRDVMLSTDYLLQALTGAYPAATKALNNIRSKYASQLGNIKDDMGSDVYNSMMEEIRQSIKETYTDSKAEEIFNKILKNATGFTYREGNAISAELEKINEENDKQIKAKYDAELATLEGKPSGDDVVQTYEYNGKTQTIKQETSTKDGVTKVTFVGERSDKPGRSSKGGYVYGGPTSNSVQQFFDDYGVTVEDIAEGLSINDIKAIKVIEERTSEGKTSITFTITYSEEMGGISSEPMEMAVKKQKFTGKIKPTTKNIIDTYMDEKRTKPVAETLSPMIIYATPATGKTYLSEQYSNVIDGDFIIYQYLVSAGVRPMVTTKEELDYEIVLSGLHLQEFFNSVKDKQGDDAIPNRIATVINMMREYKNQGYTVVTGNWFMRLNADKAYLSDDVDSIAQVFLSRPLAISPEKVMEDAKKVVADDNKIFIKGKRPHIKIGRGQFLRDILLKTKKDKTEEFLSRILKADEQELVTIEAELATLPTSELLDIDTKEVFDNINARRIILSRGVTFDDVSIDDFLMLKNGKIGLVENKALGKFITVSLVNDPDNGDMTIEEKDFENVVFGKYIKGMILPKESVPTVDNEDEYKNNTNNKGKNITKADDINTLDNAKSKKKGRKFGDNIDPKDDCGG